jgi:hypothetical protein
VLGDVLLWTVKDGCMNGENLQYTFFDEVTKGQYPSYSLAPGQQAMHALQCPPGDNICFGGRQPQHSLTWGVDIDNSKFCQNCCFTCANASVSLGSETCP